MKVWFYIVESIKIEVLEIHPSKRQTCSSACVISDSADRWNPLTSQVSLSDSAPSSSRTRRCADEWPPPSVTTGGRNLTDKQRSTSRTDGTRFGLSQSRLLPLAKSEHLSASQSDSAFIHFEEIFIFPERQLVAQPAATQTNKKQQLRDTINTGVC